MVAADVFGYVGALDEVFRVLAPRMPAGGAFAFTVEESQEGELVLRPSLRYAHSEAGLRRLARVHGFDSGAVRLAAEGLGHRFPQGLVQVPEDVLDVLDADGQPNHVRPHAGTGELIFIDLTVSVGRSIDVQSL